MRYLFDNSSSDPFEGFLSKPTVLAFDFDGTLAPIVCERDAAVMRPATIQRFVQVCDRYTCAVVTGRSRRDVVERLGSANIWRIVGHHGLETDSQSNTRPPEIAAAAQQLRHVLKDESGIELEDKGLSLALHFRRARNQQDALEAIDRAVLRLPPGLRRIEGKSVVNLVPEHAPDKGDAILALRDEARASRVLYVGDDITDEDVFELRQPSWLMTLRVGRSSHSKASYFLHDQGEIDRLLDELLRLAHLTA